MGKLTQFKADKEFSTKDTDGRSDSESPIF